MANLETRPTIDVRAAVFGWPYPWPNVAEVARVLPSDRWTLIGGLMTQLHAIHHRIDAVRPTNDVDIVLHIETARGTPSATASATLLETFQTRADESSISVCGARACGLHACGELRSPFVHSTLTQVDLCF